MSEEHKEVVQKVIRSEKVKVLLYPVAFFALVYGIWISIQPTILRNYDVYNLISNLVSPHQVGAVFITLSALILISYWFEQRRLLLITTLLLFTIWSTFTVAFVLSPPPNTVWLLSATWTYFTFELVRRV